VRATWLTDLHLNFLDEERLRACVANATRTEPDIVFVTGDTGEASRLARFIARLDAIAPVYLVLGNQDFYGSSIDEVRAHARAHMRWRPAVAPVQRTAEPQLVGVDGATPSCRQAGRSHDLRSFALADRDSTVSQCKTLGSS
jgi:hypothetical protein